jgi:hypothetical protein
MWHAGDQTPCWPLKQTQPDGNALKKSRPHGVEDALRPRLVLILGRIAEIDPLNKERIDRILAKLRPLSAVTGSHGLPEPADQGLKTRQFPSP